jgi:hypothetical protein
MHSLFAFVGADTRILAIDGYSVRFIPAVVPYKVVKSKEFKQAEKDIRTFKQAFEWACEVSQANPESADAILFPGANTSETLSKTYYNTDVQDMYNYCAKFVMGALAENRYLTVQDMLNEQARLTAIKDNLASQKWHYYKDFKNPMVSTGGKVLKHIPASIRKNIEDTMADILTARTLMTVDQLEKEEAQIKGGKKQQKKSKEEAKAEAENK